MAVSIQIRNFIFYNKFSTNISKINRLQIRKESTNNLSFTQPSGNLANLKRGGGGRSSFSGNVVTIFGATGFLGRYVTNQLGKTGSQLLIPYRGDPYYVRHLKLAGDLGQVLFMPFEIKDSNSIRKSVKYSNVVINLIGREWETKNFTFKDVNHDSAQEIARIAKEEGVNRFIHFSPITAMENPPNFYKKGSEFLRSKYYGECAVRNEFPEATIFRMADVYGQEDRFLRYYASAYRRSFRMLPLYKQGKETVKMPVCCLDVSKAVAKAVNEPETASKTYEIVGPTAYVLHDLLEYCYNTMRYSHIRKIPINPIFKLKVKFMSMMPSYPILTMDKLEREFVSDEVTGYPGLSDLGINPTRLEDRIAWELMPYRRWNSYEAKLGEFPQPDPPKNLGVPRPILF